MDKNSKDTVTTPPKWWKTKRFLIPTALCILLLFCIGDGSSDELKSENEELNNTISNLETELTQTETELADMKTDFEDKLAQAEANLLDTEAEFNTYKERMKPFEELEVAEAEARKIEAEKIAEEKAAEEKAAEKKAAEEAAAKEAAGYETGITYDQLARTPDDFMLEKVKFSGKIIQVIEDGGSTVQIRLAVNDDYDTVLLGEYDSSITDSRFLEDDMVTIYGSSIGTISYDSTMGGVITIPGVLIDKIVLQ